jgi:hypothetical protein
MPEEKWIEDVIGTVIGDVTRTVRANGFVFVHKDELSAIMRRRLTEGVAAEVERLRLELSECYEALLERDAEVAQDANT